MAAPLTAAEQEKLTRDKATVARENELYLRTHPELGVLVGKLVRAMLDKRPADPVAFAAEYFTGGSSGGSESAPVDANGAPLAVSDRVEAIYRGKGTKRFGARVTAISAAQGGYTFSLTYDDGDTEVGALPAHVWRLGAPVPGKASSALQHAGSGSAGGDAGHKPAAGSSGSEGAPVDANGAPLAVGDRVEALYRGKGTKRFGARVTAVAATTQGGCTFSLTYDDGDTEAGALPAHVWRLEAPLPAAGGPEKASGGRVSASSLERQHTGFGGGGPGGDAAGYSSAGEATGGGRRGSLGPVDADGAHLAVGDRVSARFRGRGAPAPATVVAIRGGRASGGGGSGSSVIDLQFDDGAAESGALPANVKRTGGASASETGSESAPGQGDEAGLKDEDIKAVCAQSGASRSEAVRALRTSGGDVVQALVSLV